MMNISRTFQRVGASTLTAFFLTANTAFAAGSENPGNTLICAAAEAIQCREAGACTQGPATLFNLPVIFKINFQDKTVESIREGDIRRTSQINKVNSNGSAAVLHGSDAGTEWLATIQGSSGKLTVASTRESLAYIVFGSCTEL